MMSSGDSPRKMRGVTMSAFVLEGIAAIGFIALMAFGERRMTPLEGFVLSGLLLGFFSALGSTLMVSPAPEYLPVRVTRVPERRRIERRVFDFGSPTGIERRSGHDRRARLMLTGFVAN